MLYNPEARTDIVEVCVNTIEKSEAKAHCKAIGIGLSAWYRSLGNAELQRHRNGAPAPKESRGCPGAGRLATRASGAKGAKNMRRSW